MLLGIVCYTIIFPTLESVGSYICQWLEVRRARLIVEQTKLKKVIANIEEDDPQSKNNTRVIGFFTDSSSAANDDEEEEEEYEDD